jgi:hypothetical protein
MLIAASLDALGSGRLLTTSQKLHACAGGYMAASERLGTIYTLGDGVEIQVCGQLRLCFARYSRSDGGVLCLVGICAFRGRSCDPVRMANARAVPAQQWGAV